MLSQPCSGRTSFRVSNCEKIQRQTPSMRLRLTRRTPSSSSHSTARGTGGRLRILSWSIARLLIHAAKGPGSASAWWLACASLQDGYWGSISAISFLQSNVAPPRERIRDRLWAAYRRTVVFFVSMFGALTLEFILAYCGDYRLRTASASASSRLPASPLRIIIWFRRKARPLWTVCGGSSYACRWSGI